MSMATTEKHKSHSNCVVNLKTREVMEILESTEGNWEKHFYVRFTIPAGVPGPPLHYHLKCKERFLVEQGELEFVLGRNQTRRVLAAGESLEVLPGELHGFRNSSTREVVVQLVVSPGRQFEQFIRGWYALGANGMMNEMGIPRNPLVLAQLMIWSDVNYPGVPTIFLRFLLGLLAETGRLLGVDSVIRRAVPWNPHEPQSKVQGGDNRA